MHFTDQQLQQFDTEGYLFLPGCFSTEEAAMLRAEADVIAAMAREEVVREKSGVARTAIAAQTYNEAFRRLGALMLPSSFTAAEPGSDLRHSGTFPMRAEPGPGEVGLTGELHGHAGLHLVDLSVFPAMGSKHPPLTLMANADRIGRALAAEER